MVEISYIELYILYGNLLFFIMVWLIMQHYYFKYKTKYELLRLDILFTIDIKKLIKDLSNNKK